MGEKNKRKKPVQKEELTEEQQQALDVENAETEEEAKVYKKRQFMHRFKLGSHYKMERFSVIFGTMMVMLMLFTVVGFTNHKRDQNQQLSTKALYSETVEFSLSGQTGTIDNVYTDPDGKRAVMLINMEDISNLSVDASTYELFLTGFEKKLKQEPEASLFVFGSSGYIGVELYDERGLPNQVLEFTLRANSQVHENTEELSDEDLESMEDASFGEHDQAQFYANVGAADAIDMDVLSDSLDPIELYYALVGRHDENEIFDRIEEHTSELDRLLARHNEYSNRLVELGYEAPKMPTFMDGDYVDDEGNFQPRTNVLGAHDIDYIGKRVTDGFVLQVVNDVADFRSYMAEKRAESQVARSKTDEALEEIPRLDELVRNDGYKITLSEISEEESTSNELSAKEAMTTLQSTWSQYLEQKRDLQITAMRDLLLLDADIRTQGNAFSSHSGEDFLTIW